MPHRLLVSSDRSTWVVDYRDIAVYVAPRPTLVKTAGSALSARPTELCRHVYVVTVAVGWIRADFHVNELDDVGEGRALL